jgi:hypothetical protein
MTDDIGIDVNNISVGKKIENAEIDNTSSRGRENR